MNQQANKTALAVAVSLSLISLSAAANEPPNRLDTVQVTATRIELPIEQALASVTVLERADIEKAQAPDLISLLARQAGIDIARNGGAGQASTLFLRGSNSSHALVLVDGVRVNAATQGLIDFAHFPLAQIERIEIVRGPRAALWGSDAIGGVIQIFTRDPSSAFVEARMASYERRSLDAGAGWTQGDTSLGLSVGSDRQEGFSATGPSAYGYDPDPDGYANRHFNLRGRSKLGNQALALSALVTDADVDFDAGLGPGQGHTAALNRVFGATLSGPLAGEWNHALTLGHSSEDLYTAVYVSRFGSQRDSLDWIVDGHISEGQGLSVGLNWSRESGYSDEYGSGFDVDRHNAALFARWQGHFGAHDLQVSVRHDDNSQFGGATTANLAWGWKASESLSLRASWGQGFRAPSLNELYYPGFYVGDDENQQPIILYAGNPLLRPERSNNIELGLDWQAGQNQRLGLSLYRNRIGELIGFSDENAYFEAINIRRAGIEGAELEYSWSVAGYSLTGNATWQRARDLNSGERLLRRADRKLNASLDRVFANGASVGVDLTAVSRRPEFGGQELAGYGRVDLRAAAPLAGNWIAELRLENLGNRDYELVQGYLTPGRSGMISLRWKGQ